MTLQSLPGGSYWMDSCQCLDWSHPNDLDAILSGSVCLRSNRAAAYLALDMWDEALKDAERARMLAQDALKKTYKAAPLFIKTFAQKGAALIGKCHQCLPFFHVEVQRVEFTPYPVPNNLRDSLR